jgi:DNA-binding MarR family transcriptional regulator
MTSREKLYLTAARLNRQLSQMTNDDARSALQHELMAFLADRRNATVHDVAEYLGLSESSATQLINRMVRDEIVLRHRDTSDRRLVHLKLSSRGRQTHRTYMKQQTRCLRQVFAGLTDRQLKQAISFQQHILHTLSKLT